MFDGAVALWILNPGTTEHVNTVFYNIYLAITFIGCAYYRVGGIGPAALVLAGSVFSQGKSKIPCVQKASNKQST